MSLLRKFSSRDLLLIAIFSALGLTIKPIVTPLIHLVSAPLMIPGGSLAGGFYMMWISLAMAVSGKFGTGILVGLIQAIVMITLGYFGSHGAVSLLSYSLPGIMAESVGLFYTKRTRLGFHTWSCVIANISGALIVTILVMRLPLLPLLISTVAAAISGIIGGILSWKILHKLLKFGLV
ncbi:MAG: ECF transporter S component [Candidatus Cloacimonetes bacterium]|nr:ECF transporter S component [Candidatus Cloacimonadota bacterium]